MKRILLAGAACFVIAGAAGAADLRAKMPVKAAPPAPVYEWTGFYLGGSFGSAIAQSQVSSSGSAGSSDLGKAGYAFAGQAGYNWQVAPNWLLGVEGEAGYMGTKRSFQDWNDANITVGAKTSGYGTIRGRAGYVTGPSLLYVTGGVAFVGIEQTFGGNAGLAPTTNSVTKTGWTVGGGIETKLSRNWSTTAEYLYIDAGSTDFVGNPYGVAETVTFKHQYHLLKTAFNYKFGGPSEPLPFFGAPLLSSAQHWNGFYAGVNAGGGLGLSKVGGGQLAGGEADMNGGGFAGGVQAGYNYILWSKWLVGVEGDIGYFGLDRSYSEWSDTVSLSQKTDWYGTLRGRVGSTTGPALMYVTGGAAFAKVRDGITVNTGVSDVSSRTASGWTFGGGTEIALDARWSAKLEYLYMDLGKSTHSVSGVEGEFKDRFQVVRAGLNYRFGASDLFGGR